MTQNTQPLLRTDDLVVRYTGDDGVQALNSVSVSFNEHRLTALLGPSGSGKSTLLKSLNRLHAPQPNVEIDGEVYLRGEPLYDTDRPLPEIRRRIGYVPQTPTPLPMSIYDNVAYGVKLHHDPSPSELDTIVEQRLREVNLWTEVNDRLETPGAELSTGQIQRLCLARSLAVEPDVLLCDEVTSSLDPVSSETVEETLMALCDEYTIIMITHSMQQAQRLADDVIFLYLGDVLETTDAASFFEGPEAKRAQRFVGTTGQQSSHASTVD